MVRPAKSKASTTQLLILPWQRFQSADLTTNLLNDLHWLLCAAGTIVLRHVLVIWTTQHCEAILPRLAWGVNDMIYMIYAPLHRTWLGLSARPPGRQPRRFTRGHSEVLARAPNSFGGLYRLLISRYKDNIQEASKKLRRFFRLPLHASRPMWSQQHPPIRTAAVRYYTCRRSSLSLFEY